MDSTTYSTKKKTKLSLRNQTCFKKASKKTTNLFMREQTVIKKASELSTLCGIEVCVIYYGPDGELIKTWPEDKSKVRDMAERYAKLNYRERRKKSSNLSQVLHKKILNDKKTSLDNNDGRFSKKVLEMEVSLESRLPIFQAKLLRLLNPDEKQTTTEPADQIKSRTVSSGFFKSTNLSSPLQQLTYPSMNNNLRGVSGTEQDLVSHKGGSFTTDLSPLSIIDNPHQQWTESLMSGVSSTEQDLSMSSLDQQQSKFSVFLYNHDNGSFCQLPDSSVSSFGQVTAPYNNLMSTPLLGEQGVDLRSSINNNNVDLPMLFPPQMQTQSPLLQFDQFAAWNQIPSFCDAMMFSSSN